MHTFPLKIILDICVLKWLSLLKFDYHLGGYAGGDQTGNILRTTEFIYLNGSTTEGPIELPEPTADHCMVEYAGIVISMGGQYVTHCAIFCLIPKIWICLHS